MELCCERENVLYRTLLVDVNETFRMELKQLPIWQEHSGFCVAGEAFDGLHALKLLRKSSFDLVITDICMPKITGIELLQAIKAEKLCPCTVLLSEHTDFFYVHSALVSGAFDYLVKPVNQDDLFALLLRVNTFMTEDLHYVKTKESILPEGCVSPCIPRIVAEIVAGKQTVAAFAEEILSGLYEFCHNALQPTIESGNRIMLSVLGEVWQQCPWLRHYYRVGFFVGMVHRPFTTFEDYRENWGKIIQSITAAVRELLPVDPNSTVGRVCTYILDRPEESISLRDLANLFYINRSYLSGIFHKNTGMPFITYFQKIRILHARLLIETENLRANKLCTRSGYRDTYYFTHLFKKIIGSTPSSFQKDSSFTEEYLPPSHDPIEWLTE